MRKKYVPLHAIADRRLSVLEAIVEYLHEKKSMSFHEIALATKRDDRTIWTCYRRAKKKRAKNES